MRPQITKRWSSSVIEPKPHKGRKGRLYAAEKPHPPPTPEEEIRITRRRHMKAERDERMDITRALTPPKTYMGGFTRPRDLRATSWFPGGPYVQSGRVYESPPESAYEPHTVFLLETRYRVRHGIGRVDAKDHVVGVCRAVDFVKLVAKYNSDRCPPDAWQSVDSACWPWIPKSGKSLKRTVWWGENERLVDIMKDIHEDYPHDTEVVKQALVESKNEDDCLQLRTDGVPNEGTGGKCPSFSSGIHPSIPFSELPLPTDINQLRDRMSSSRADSTVNPTSMPTPHNSLTQDRPLSPEKGHNIPQTSVLFDVPKLRAMYLSHISKEPFWRPLLAITLSTRPLALSLSRLSKSMERGLPFYASVSNDDRKCLFSFSARMTNLRLNRIYKLTGDIVTRLAGRKGGFVGIRFSMNERGRGICGEGLADPIPLNKRAVKVQVGHWYQRADEVYELYENSIEEWAGRGALDVAFMNEWGRRLDALGNEVPLTEEELIRGDVQRVDDEAESESEETLNDQDGDEGEVFHTCMGSDRRNKRKFHEHLRMEDETGVALRKKLTLRYSQRHRSVIQV